MEPETVGGSKRARFSQQTSCWVPGPRPEAKGHKEARIEPVWGLSM